LCIHPASFNCITHFLLIQLLIVLVETGSLAVGWWPGVWVIKQGANWC
jgi:hypothetical protein